MKTKMNLEEFRKITEGRANYKVIFHSPGLTTGNDIVSPVIISPIHIEKILVNQSYPAHINFIGKDLCIRVGQIGDIIQNGNNLIIHCGFLPQNASLVEICYDSL